MSKLDHCEWGDCEVQACCSVHAQWTPVDFVQYFACLDHQQAIFRVLAARSIDGHWPRDMWTTWWDVEGDYVEESTLGDQT